MNDPKIVEDSFYEDCLEIGRIPAGSQSIRVALVHRDSTVGLDIRKFKRDGKPTTGILFNSQEQVQELLKLLNDSTAIVRYADSGKIDFDSFDKEDVSNG